jgi:superfamily II DNA or RNA helicase
MIKTENTDVLKPKIEFVQTGRDFFGETHQEYLRGIVTNLNRNTYIINKTHGLFLEGRRIIVMSHRVQHAEALYEMMLAMWPKTKSFARFVVSKNQKKVEIDSSVRLLFTTYQLLGEGSDFPSFDTEVLCTPFKDKIQCKQIPGRILRKSQKQQPLVVDLVDSDPKAKRYYYERVKWYKEYKFNLGD